jgi:cytoskeletal protein RodZ
MKKRKNSTPLVISLVAIVLIAFGFNGLQQGLFNDLIRQSNTSASATPPTANANSVATQTKNALSAIDDTAERSAAKPDPKATEKAQPVDGKAMAAKKMKEQNGGRPFMAMAPNQIARPTPNDSSIATQWYTEKARKPQ